jgi:uncharacterized protein
MNVMLHLTDACNFRCGYCLNRPGELGAMPWEVAQRGIDLAIAMSITMSHGHVGVQFYGGEPLLEWELLCQCCNYARSKARDAGLDCIFTLTTNGSLLDKKLCRFLRRRKIAVTISCEGTPERQNKWRPFANGTKTSVVIEENLCRTIRVLPDIIVCMVADPRDLSGLVDGIAYLADMGVQRFQIDINYFVPWDKQHIAQWEDILAEMAELYEERASRDQPISIPLFDEKLATWAFGGYRPGTACPACEQTFSVTPDGHLYRCRAFTTDYPCASPPFGDVWRGPLCEAQEVLRAGSPRDHRCKQCELAPRCIYWCRCANLFTSGDPERPGELICRTQIATARLADRISATLLKRTWASQR